MEAIRYGREVRWLLQTAMVVFLVTIGLGMARGLGFIEEFEESQAVTHLHAGAFGWGALGLLAGVFWLYGSGAGGRSDDRWVTGSTVALIVGVPLFVVGWWIASWPLVAVGGSLLLLGIIIGLGALVGEAAAVGYRELTTPRLGAVLGVFGLVVGTTLGVIIAGAEATGSFTAPEAWHTAHGQAQELGFIVLVAMSLVYWRLRADERTRGGTWMVWLFFAGFGIVTLSLLADAVEGSIAYIPLFLAAFVVLVALTWRQLVGPGSWDPTRWAAAGSHRHYAIAVMFAIVSLAIIVYLILGITALGLFTVDTVPWSLIVAQTHALFLGAVTNVVFGLLSELNLAKRAVWPWADQVLFWGLNLAVTAFVIALLVDAEDLFKFISPVLGVALLLGIAVHSLRLWSPGPVPMADASAAAEM